MKKEVLHHHFESIDSTNVWLKQHCHDISPDELVVVTAAEQTAGRGRQGRNWSSPKGVNLYLSFGLVWKREWTDLPLCAAVSVAETLEDLGFSPGLKWPNDIFLNGKKVGGILCEVKDSKAIVGIGLNVNMDQSQLDLIDQPAISLMVERGQEFGLHPIRDMLTERFADNLDKDLLDAYKKRLLQKEGEHVSLRDGKKTIQGVFRGIDERGFFILEEADGTIRLFSSGDLNPE